MEFLLLYFLYFHLILYNLNLSFCEKIHNRDKNAVQNMLNIVKSVFDTGKRPEIFCRALGS
jgi:hypothetical protein